MSHGLARFEAEELIDRSVDRSDRRSMRLGLSPEGHARLRAFEKALAGVLRDRAGDLREGTRLLGFPVGPDTWSELSVLEAGDRLGGVGAAYVDDVPAVMRPIGALEWRERFVMALIHRHAKDLADAMASALIRPRADSAR